MIQASIFLCLISILAYFGYRMIRGPVVRFLFLLHSLGVFLMLGLPSLWHAYTGFSGIGFLGLVYDADQIAIAATDLQISVVYVFSLTAVGFIIVSRLFGNRINLIGNFAHSVPGPHYATMFVLFSICTVFFVSYYKDLNSILLFRSRENVVLPLYFELLRGTIVAACTYSTIVLATTKFISKPVGFVLTLSLFLFSLALMVGFGSRNLLVYPIAALIMIFMLKRDRSLFRRNVFLAGIMLIIFTTVSLFQSSFRDAGFADGERTIHVEHLLLAFDQFDALYVAFETASDFTRPEWSVFIWGFATFQYE